MSIPRREPSTHDRRRLGTQRNERGQPNAAAIEEVFGGIAAEGAAGT
jgi:hypothetical protein